MKAEREGKTERGKQTLGEAFRWGWASIFSFLGNVGLTVFFKEVLGMPPPAAFAAALILIVITNFFMLRYLVFDISHLPVGRQARRFGMVTLAFRAGEWAVFSLVHFISGPDYRLLVVAVLLASSAIKFFTYRKVLSG